MQSTADVLSQLRGNLIVSCQAAGGSAFRHPDSISRFAQAAVEGGAAGIRANGPEDIRAIRQVVGVPIIGIWKVEQDDGEILITPSFEAAQKLVEAGGGLVAIDCTRRLPLPVIHSIYMQRISSRNCSVAFRSVLPSTPNWMAPGCGPSISDAGIIGGVTQMTAGGCGR